MVFLTDGSALITPKFLSSFLELKKKKEFKVSGVLIQSLNVDTLKKFSDYMVEVADLLDAEAEALLEI